MPSLPQFSSAPKIDNLHPEVRACPRHCRCDVPCPICFSAETIHGNLLPGCLGPMT